MFSTPNLRNSSSSDSLAPTRTATIIRRGNLIRRGNSKNEQQSSCSNPELPTPPASPAHSAQEVGVPSKQSADSTSISPDKKPLDGMDNLDIGSLQGRLDLDDWKCGSQTKTTGKPCNRRIPAEKQAKALTRLQSLVSLQSLENLDKELRLLATTVHCYQHNHDPNLDHRVEQWKAAFPQGDIDFEPNAAISARIMKVLGEVSVRCVGTTSDVACSDYMGGQKVQNCSKTIQEIVKPEIYSHNDELEYFLQVLAENMYCHVHKSQSPKQVKTWRLEITKFRDAEGLEPSLMTENKGHLISGPAQAKSAFMRVSTPKTISSSLCNRSTPKPRNARSVSPAEYWPEIYDTTLFKILPSSRFSMRQPVPSTLQKADRGAGFLYAYEVEGNKGFVKIGYTTRSVKDRLDKWSFDCNRASKLIYPTSFNTSVAVSNAAYVERRCHAELKRQNIRIYCSGCLKPHIEWFKISPSEAIFVIEKWSKWMKSQSYQPSSIDSSDE